MIEEWKPVQGYERLYAVSSLGRVRSMSRVVRREGNSSMRLRGVELEHSSQPSGHRKVTLSQDGVRKNCRVHRLVAEAFLGQPLPGQEVRHLDGNPSNNAVENLAWGSRSENTRDRVLHGTHHESMKTRCPRGHELRPSNLVPSNLIRGSRSCLSCSRGRAFIKGRGMDMALLPIVSNRYYEEIAA